MKKSFAFLNWRFCNLSPFFPQLLVKENGRRLLENLCMNFILLVSIIWSRGSIFKSLNSNEVWALKFALDTNGTAFFCFRNNAFKEVFVAQPKIEVQYNKWLCIKLA